MDPEKIEDQFSKLHPCLPLDTRIGIIGGGPSGLSAAYGLTKLGYTNVVVLEKCHSVGGMCESVEIKGTNNENGIYLLRMHCYTVDNELTFFFLGGRQSV